MISEIWENIQILRESNKAQGTGEITPYEGEVIRSYYSDRFALVKDKTPLLQNRFEELCQKAKLKRVPKFIIAEHSSVNATNIRTGSIVVTTGAIEHLKQAELDVLLSHEITHQLQRKGRVAMWFVFPLVEFAAGALAAIATSKASIINVTKTTGLLAVAAAYQAAGWITGKLLEKPRQAFASFLESDADRGALIITGDLEAAIGQIKKGAEIKEIAKRREEENAKLPIATTTEKKFEPHKIMNERIKQMKQFKADIESGKINRSRISRL